MPAKVDSFPPSLLLSLRTHSPLVGRRNAIHPLGVGRRRDDVTVIRQFGPPLRLTFPVRPSFFVPRPPIAILLLAPPTPTKIVRRLQYMTSKIYIIFGPSAILLHENITLRNISSSMSFLGGPFPPYPQSTEDVI